MPSWCGAQLRKAEGQFYLYLFLPFIGDNRSEHQTEKIEHTQNYAGMIKEHIYK
jgi:hypothetical protein